MTQVLIDRTMLEQMVRAINIVKQKSAVAV